VGGLIIIEPVSVKRHSFGKTILNLASRGGSMSSSLHKGNDKGWSWNALGTVKYMETKKPICLSNSGNRETNWRYKIHWKKKDVSAYSYYNTTIEF
jgi:iron complex outermembrane receptor protein